MVHRSGIARDELDEHLSIAGLLRQHLAHSSKVRTPPVD